MSLFSYEYARGKSYIVDNDINNPELAHKRPLYYMDNGETVALAKDAPKPKDGLLLGYITAVFEKE